MAIQSMMLEPPLVKEVKQYAGLLANIPSGWSLCDGAGGRPDLRDKFIKGVASAENPGATGGSATHSAIINHLHPVTDPGHGHLTQRYPTATGALSGFTIDASMSGTIADNTLPVKNNTTGVTTANPAGGVASINHEPPYYKLAYITKPEWWV